MPANHRAIDEQLAKGLMRTRNLGREVSEQDDEQLTVRQVHSHAVDPFTSIAVQPISNIKALVFIELHLAPVDLSAKGLGVILLPHPYFLWRCFLRAGRELQLRRKRFLVEHHDNTGGNAFGQGLALG